MYNQERLTETHIREYEARMKHIDELISRAERAEHLTSAQMEELGALRGQRARLADELEQIKSSSLEEWAKKGGPMIIWDLVAERAEKLIEHIE